MGELTDKAKGKIKQAAGDLTGNKNLKKEGETDELKGNVEGSFRKVKGAAKNAVDDVKDAIQDLPKK